MTNPPRFAADTMLGRLAHWLRLLGYDCAYGAHLTGRALLRAARTEGRILLTRQRALLRHLDVPHLLIESDHFRKQLVQVISAYQLDLQSRLLSRCPECNRELQSEPRAKVEGRVPPFVAQTQEQFRACPLCHRIFWAGTHHEHIRAELAALEWER